MGGGGGHHTPGGTGHHGGASFSTLASTHTQSSRAVAQRAGGLHPRTALEGKRMRRSMRPCLHPQRGAGAKHPGLTSEIGWELKGENTFSTKERQAVCGQHPPARNPRSTNQRRFHLTSRLGYWCISQRAPHSCFVTNHPEPWRPSGRRGSSSSRSPEVLFRAGFALGWSSHQDTLFTLRIVGRPRAHLMPGSTTVLTPHRPAKPHGQARGPRESRETRISNPTGRFLGERQVLRSCWVR